MTDPEPEPSPEKTEIEKLRDEFAEQFATLKASYAAEQDRLTAELTALKSHNEELERALIRTATNPPPAPAPAPKTEKEEYDERVAAIAKRTLHLMEVNR